jgi:hypothetical protein
MRYMQNYYFIKIGKEKKFIPNFLAFNFKNGNKKTFSY